ncbi:MAG: UDP-N-acetylmuramoyl-L-alanine--D-glutamate ligase [Eubacteriales bacterium]
MKISLDEIFRGKTVALLGAGVSNMPLAEIAAASAAKLTVRDKKSPEALGDAAVRLRELGAELITGEDYLKNLNEELIFRSPGIRPDLPELRAAAERGSEITSEMEMFLSLEPCPVYAVTGSDGKTTTTTITSLLLEAGLGREHVFLGGNIGEPLLHRYPNIREKDAVAVELSSFQLMTVDAPVEVAAITNITPNHLNWHTDMEEYVRAKKRLLKHCRRAVLNYDNDLTRQAAAELQQSTTPVTLFSLAPIPDDALRTSDSAVWLDGDTIFSRFPDEGIREVMTRRDIRLPGLHNTANFMTAIAVTHGKVSYEAVREIARTFGGVEHRLEFVREVDGVTYINGSIDSSPTRTAAALSAISDRPVVLIVGGSDKNLDYGPFAETVFASSVHTIVLTGATMEKVYAAFTAAPGYENALARGFCIQKNPSFDGAVLDARAAARPGDTVILSPAAASFDAFPNFMVRGQHFKNLVMSF